MSFDFSQISLSFWALSSSTAHWLPSSKIYPKCPSYSFDLKTKPVPPEMSPGVAHGPAAAGAAMMRNPGQRPDLPNRNLPFNTTSGRQAAASVTGVAVGFSSSFSSLDVLCSSNSPERHFLHSFSDFYTEYRPLLRTLLNFAMFKVLVLIYILLFSIQRGRSVLKHPL